MATHQFLPLLIIALTTISVASGAGITIDLIHRDSPRSPLSSSPATSHADKLYNSFRRSIQRARQITLASRASPSLIDAPVIPAGGGGEYLVSLTIGTPPTQFLGIVDTGSDLTWTQCEPCRQCFNQDLPVFDPAKSTSYATLTCDSDACGALAPQQQGCSSANTCAYKYSYGDKSYTIGDLATETLAVGSAQLQGFTIGCGHQNQGKFQRSESGLVGLGQGPLSLASQTKTIPVFGGKFAYCLIPFDGESTESKISFGDDALVSGDDVVSTPIVSGQVSTYYYLTLEGVSVGEQTLPFKTRSGSGSGQEDFGSTVSEGNIVIDSGTTLTFLPKEMFDGLLSELKTQIKGEPVDDPRATLQLCYEGVVEVPKITFHFTGADLGLGGYNTFIELTENVYCLSFLPANEITIFGNLAQADFTVAYDLDAKTVSFKPTDCKTYAP